MLHLLRTVKFYSILWIFDKVFDIDEFSATVIQILPGFKFRISIIFGKMIYVKSLFACICLASVVLAQIPNFGRCPDYGKIFLKKMRFWCSIIHCSKFIFENCPLWIFVLLHSDWYGFDSLVHLIRESIILFF